jgi:hypothetical protein
MTNDGLLVDLHGHSIKFLHSFSLPILLGAELLYGRGQGWMTDMQATAPAGGSIVQKVAPIARLASSTVVYCHLVDVQSSWSIIVSEIVTSGPVEARGEMSKLETLPKM